MSETSEPQAGAVEPTASPSVNKFTHLIFFWCLGGISVIYGIRLYHDIPIHPSFIPIIGAAFAAVLSFTLVVAFKIAAGPIDFEADKIKVKGATGLTVLWCICFLTISYGLYLLGIGDASKAVPSTNYYSCSTTTAMFGQCRPQSLTAPNPSSVGAPVNPTIPGK